jgi:hypothetical protein
VAQREKLGDGSAHRVADGDRGAGGEGAEHRCRVVGAVGEPEAIADARPASVAAVVDRDHLGRAGERFEAAGPVERSSGAEPVQQQERRFVAPTASHADERRPVVVELEAPAARDPAEGQLGPLDARMAALRQIGHVSGDHARLLIQCGHRARC